MMWIVTWLMFLPWISSLGSTQHLSSPKPTYSRVIPIHYNISRSPKGTVKPVLTKLKHNSGRKSFLNDDREALRTNADNGNKSSQLAAVLRRQLMQDNYDYMPSDSAPKETEERIHNMPPPRAYHPNHSPNPTTLSTQQSQNTFNDFDSTPKSSYIFSTLRQSLLPHPPSSSSHTFRRPYSDESFSRPYSDKPYPRNHPRDLKQRDTTHKKRDHIPRIFESNERKRTGSASRSLPNRNFYDREKITKATLGPYSTTSMSTLDSFITLFDRDTWKMKNRPEFNTDFLRKKENINTNIFNSFEKLKQTTQRMFTSKKTSISYYDRYSSSRIRKKLPKFDDWEVFREPLDNLQDNNFDNTNGSRYNTGYPREEETTTSYSTARWGNGPNKPYPHVDLTKKSRDTDSEKDYEQYIMKKLQPIMVLSNKANDNFNRKFNTLVNLDSVRHEQMNADDEGTKTMKPKNPVASIDHIHVGNRGDVSKKGKVASFEAGMVQRAHDPDYESPTYINNKLKEALESQVTVNINKRSDPYTLLKNATDVTKVKHVDLLYYVDDSRLSDLKQLTFHADTALHDSERPEMRRSNVLDDKSYKILKLKNDNRRLGSERRFIQEEGANGVSIVKVDPGPFPEFLLSGDRRQYMSQDNRSGSEPDPDLPDTSESNETTAFDSITSTTNSFTSVKVIHDPNVSELSVE